MQSNGSWTYFSKESSRDTVFVEILKNTKPVAQTKQSIRAFVGEEVFLDGSDSFDLTYVNDLEYLWIASIDNHYIGSLLPHIQ